jgi:predicted glycosyltransferase
MKKLMFYCQHLLGIGHLVRSLEIVRGLANDFQICFVNGGELVRDISIPQGIEIVNLPAIKTDLEFQELQVVDSNYDLAKVQELRKQELLNLLQKFQPDILAIELFPFGRRQFSFELIPLLEEIKQKYPDTKVVCSLRDIIIRKKEPNKHEEKVIQLMNKYFDLLLIHGDRSFLPLEETFSRVKDINCPVRYTGYVVQEENYTDTAIDTPNKPSIVVSVGGGRFGHELLECVVRTASILETKIPHQIQIFTGCFIPEAKFLELQELAQKTNNLNLKKYTNNLLGYLKAADLSISMGGYNTTMNILTTGVRAMILPFTGNGDREQTIRAEKLEKLGVLRVIHPEDLQPELFTEKIINHLKTIPSSVRIDLQGVEKTKLFLNELLTIQKIVA